MGKDKNETVRIGYLGYGAYLPECKITNAQMETMVDTSDAWIQQRTGIRSRRVLGENETILQMAVAAAREAITDAGITADQIGDIRVGVNTWFRFPSLATQVQKELGAVNAAACDVSAGCAGFLYAVEEAFTKIHTEKTVYGQDLVALVIGVDGLSHITNWRDRNTCVLLGDGAGAVIMGKVQEGGILATHSHADGRLGDLLYSDSPLEQQWNEAGSDQPFSNKDMGVRPYLHMDGKKVYAVAVKTMVRDAQIVLEKYNRNAPERIGLNDISFVFPHQANLRIIEAVARRLELPLSACYTDGVVRYGNTSTASIPIGYKEMRSRTKGRFEIDLAFGAGMASASILREN